jgi:hypothetical protein
MISKHLHSFVALLALGALLGAGAVAEAATVRAQVGKPLLDAQADAAAGHCEAAKDKIREAEGVGGKSGAESAAVDQMKQYVDVKCGSADSAIGARAKFANDYNAGRYRDAIEDGALLRKYGALDANSMQVIAQAYYKSGDYEGCVRYIKENLGSGAGQSALELQMRCAYEVGDTDSEREALETLVARTGQPQYWAQLLDASEKTRGLNDHETLDIYRIRLLTGSMRKSDDYKLLAELALAVHCAGEAQAVIEKGMKANVAGVAGNEFFTRLDNTARATAAADAANLPRLTAAANAAKTGDALVSLGESQWGIGKGADTVKLVQAGIAKGVSDKDNASLRLGMGYLGAGQKDSALHAFASVKSDPKEQVVAHLWSLYARR